MSSQTVMELSASSARERQVHELRVLELEAKKRAFSMDVPTLPQDVRTALRQLGHPVRLFGENLANVRDRLRLALARLEIMKEKGMNLDLTLESIKIPSSQETAATIQEIQYTRATQDLVDARKQMTEFSLQRAQKRLEVERQRREQAQRKRARLTSTSKEQPVGESSAASNDQAQTYYPELHRLDQACADCYQQLRSISLEGSQYGDPRPLSAIAVTTTDTKSLVATGSWSGTLQLWDGSSALMDRVGCKNMAHEDRIMGLAWQPNHDYHSLDFFLCATASIDLTAKLWKIPTTTTFHQEESTESYTVEEVAHLKGHAARLCNTAFHPMGRHVGTTSFDHTWRLWDVETGQQLLLQDGHAMETYGLGFHPDGSLCATSDFGSVLQLWDLRTGKSVHHFANQHAKRVLCCEWSPINGFQLATAGDDGTIKIWDLRQRQMFVSVPAHSNLITQLKWDVRHEGEYLASSSFDGTAKLWSTRDWNLIQTLRGHEGKVMGVDLLHHHGVVTCGFDKTLKYWQ